MVVGGGNSAGILVYRIHDGVLQVLLAHPGGPIWAKKDDGAWSIFKGVIDPGEELFETAKREFQEESGQELPEKPLIALGNFKRKDGKTVHAWALEQDYDPADIVSNTCEIVWPPRSGKVIEIPENDRAEWFDAAAAPRKLFLGQGIFIERLIHELREQGRDFAKGDAAVSDSAEPSLF